jgi:nucleoside-diphosphate-sugar epimerase
MVQRSSPNRHGKSILVTGATGFIGRRLAHRLGLEACDVVGLGSRDGDIASPSTLEKFADREFLHVFHLAGKTYVPDSWTDPHAFYRANVLGTANVLEFCRRGRFALTFVSAYLYGQPKRLPIPESSAVAPNNPYALSKHLAEELCRFYSEVHGTRVTVVRPFNAYGPGQPDRFLIPTIVKQVLHADEIVVQDLSPKRDYLYLDDLVDGLVKTLPCRGAFNAYNFGTGTSMSVRDVIDSVQDVAGTRKNVRCDSAVRPGEIPDVVADCSKAMRELDWRPQHSFREGIRKTLASMAEGHP